MATVEFYSKGQVDAKIPSAAQLVPSTSGATSGDVLTFDGSDVGWAAAGGGLPDPTSAAAGDVLTLDSSKNAVWQAPSSGGADLEGVAFTMSSSNFGDFIEQYAVTSQGGTYRFIQLLIKKSFMFVDQSYGSRVMFKKGEIYGIRFQGASFTLEKQSLHGTYATNNLRSTVINILFTYNANTLGFNRIDVCNATTGGTTQRTLSANLGDLAAQVFLIK